MQTKTQAEKGAQRRQAIISAATAVFAEKGFAAASMNDIVTAAGMSKGGVYWHFASKDDLILTVMEQFFNREMDSLAELSPLPLPVADKMYRLLHRAVQDLQKMGPLLPVVVDFYALSVRDGPVRSFIQDYFHQYARLLADLISQGVDGGEFKAVDPLVTAVAIAAQFEGLALLWTIDGQNFALDTYFEQAFQLFMEGLKQ